LLRTRTDFPAWETTIVFLSITRMTRTASGFPVLAREGLCAWPGGKSRQHETDKGDRLHRLVSSSKPRTYDPHPVCQAPARYFDSQPGSRSRSKSNLRPQCPGRVGPKQHASERRQANEGLMGRVATPHGWKRTGSLPCRTREMEGVGLSSWQTGPIMRAEFGRGVGLPPAVALSLRSAHLS
jgi:hypothetical protein